MHPLISAGELGDLMSAGAAPTILDVRYRLGGPGGPQEHAAGHVPTAAYVDLDADLAAPPGGADGGRHPLPHPGAFEAAMRRCGVSEDRAVVVYDDWHGLAAGRCWWLLRHHGHRDVRLLDGGWRAWVAAGGAVETGSHQGPSGDFTADPGPASDVVDAGAVSSVDVLIDARAAARYRGDEEPVDPVAGHIPGARNVPTAANLRDDGRFRPVDELRELYAAAGALPGADVAVYCGSGVTAVHDLIALELVGVRARLYPGSWSEWSADASRPVATGDADG